jgi:hypothetical protein
MTATLVIYGAGPRDPMPLDPAEIQFKAQRAKSCRICLFHGQWVSVCNHACKEAIKRGMPECGDNYVYVAVEADERQLNLLSEPTGSAIPEGSDHTKPTMDK